MVGLATIQKLHDIQPHPNPEVEKLEVAKIKAWSVVVPKGQYKEGDLVVFICIDSILPDDGKFEFMRKQKFRVWNARFKGYPSQGLVQPISILSDVIDYPVNIGLGDDVSELLGITKYEKPLDVSVSGEQQCHFPTHFISISDELNLLGYPEALNELDGKEVVVTQKADGSSTTFINSFEENSFMACTRRFAMKEGSGFPWRIVEKYDLKNKLSNYNIVIQGETIGPKLNGNRLGLKDIELRVFRAKNLSTGMTLSYDMLEEMCEKFNIPTVKFIDRFVFDKNVHSVELFQNLANLQTYPNGNAGEGIVIAPVVPFYSTVLGKEWSVKVINQSYKQD